MLPRSGLDGRTQCLYCKRTLGRLKEEYVYLVGMATSEVDGFPENFTADKAKALREILAALTGGEVVEALEAAREAAGNDMVALMTRVFPLVTQVTTKVISNYGFTQDGVGAIQFEHVMKNLGQDDPEVARLHAQVRSYFLPAVVIPPSSHP
ncbi:protein C10 isoform X2 [Panulirus ornatus]|uniref:protein C10 isoform X2 n=1 Tax=Panulirus ornatus TaxID=150431 RepID=UPI003A8C0B40